VEIYDGAIEATGDDTTQHMRFACLVIKATDTQSEYVTLIAYLQLQLLLERA
jgi:hypothetical protein